MVKNRERKTDTKRQKERARGVKKEKRTEGNSFLKDER